MKHLLKTLLILAAAALSTSCNLIETEVDWAPVTIIIYAQNGDGTDLLNPDSEGFMATSVTAEWDGQQYTYTHPTDDDGEQTTRAYLPQMNGLVLDENQNVYFLTFGEISGGREWDNDLTLRWADGSQDVIHFSNKTNEFTLSSKRAYTLNGQPCSNPVTIVRNPKTEDSPNE